MKRLFAIGIIFLFIGMTISSSTGFNLEKQSTICISNNPPYVPSDPEPENGSTGVDTGVLSWTGGDPDPDDMVTYEIYFGDETNPPYIMLIGPCPANLTNFIYQIGQPLEYCTTYYWQIVAEDNNGATTEGPLWSFTTMKCSGNILYVGGDGPGNYTKIQDAIDNASDGDAVFVYDDSSPYYENVVVDKSINLFGENRDTTVIDGGGSGDVVHVSADWVNISGFKIRNSGSSWYYAGIEIRSKYNIISGNNITSNYHGITIVDKQYNVIIGNIIQKNSQNIYMTGAKRTNISHNNITKSPNYGIIARLSEATIYDNNIKNNRVGVHLDGNWAGACEIYGNDITDNKEIGIEIAYVDGNKICFNNIKNHSLGILMHSSTDFNTFHRNNFIGNKFNVICDRATHIFYGNYWNRPRILPKVVIGLRTYWIIPPDPPGSPGLGFDCPWPMFDWRPALRPYDIEV